MRTVYITLFFVAAACSLADQPSHEREFVSFEPSAFQSKEKLAAQWNTIAEDRRDALRQYLFSLGMSSTGAIQLIGVYRKGASGTLLHFQQLDLHGSRLFWSVLVDPEDMSGRVIYHTQHDRISNGFETISTKSEK